VIMLTLTQLSVGAFVVAYAAERLAAAPLGSLLAQTLYACALAIVALGASVFHLGRPLLAYRAVLGLRTSWLSREALVFGLFAQLAITYGLLVAAPLLPAFPGRDWLLSLAPMVRIGAVVSGLLGVFCSVMVYVVTRREQWSFGHTGTKFFSTTLLLGCASVLTVSTWGESVYEAGGSSLLLSTIVGTTLAKLAFEGKLLTHASDRRTTALKRMALVMRGELERVTLSRFALLIVGGLILPAVLTWRLLPPASATPVTLLIMVTLLAGELAERYLFFRAAPASRMPGSLR
jgi:DMSO reductase anchor subunit